MLVILKDLDQADHFGIIDFDDSIHSWKRSLTRATEDNVAEAVTFVKQLRDRGG